MSRVKNKSILFTILAQFVAFSGFAQYVSPLDCKLELSANYAEARSNHYHSGIDIRTEQREGIVVRAVADGFISRVGIAPYGFGRVLYVTHYNGKTSVYAHLKSFNPEMEAYLSKERYLSKSHAINKFTPSDLFPVKAGDKIGLSGNSGMSFGPHLHFEIRESATQRTLNPILVGNFNIPDNVAPRFLKAFYVTVDTIQGVPVRSNPRSISLKKISNNQYVPSSGTPVKVGANGYFIIQVADAKNGSGSQNMAPHKIIQRVDGITNFEIIIDGFEFANTRYVNATTDYVMQRTTKSDVYLLAKKQGNKMPIYGEIKNNGVISLPLGKKGVIEIDVIDDCGNKASLSMDIIGGKGDRIPAPHQTVLSAKYNKPFYFSANGATLSIPKGGLYESIFYHQKISPKTNSPLSAKRLSPIYEINKADIPLHLRSKLSIKADSVPARLRSRVMIASLSSKGKWSSVGGKYANGEVHTTIRSFGEFCIVADTIAPTVKPSFVKGANLTKSSKISFIIKDNFAGISKFNATIDGKWILFEQDVLRSRITHYFDNEHTPKTGQRHNLAIEVTDGCGNKTIIDSWFTR